MTINELKQYIYKENKIQFILEHLGCGNIKYNESKGYWSASFPDGDNPMGIVVNNNEYLGCYSYSRSKCLDENADLISLVQVVNKMTFINALKHIYNILNIPFKLTKQIEKVEKKFDALEIFKKIRRKNTTIDVEEIHSLDDKLLNDFVPLLHIDWVKNDGITNRARDKFGICYSYRNHRIVIPIRYALTGELLAFNCRTTIENYSEFGIKKYLLSSGYNKSDNVYGMWENREEIERKKVVVVYESEKSVLKRYSRMDGTGIAIQGRTMSEEQRRLILGLEVSEVVICLDNDTPIEEILHMAEKFYRIRKVSFIYDKWNLLEPKSCAADASIKIFDFLFKHRTVYDKKCHQEYLKLLNKSRI